MHHDARWVGKYYRYVLMRLARVGGKMVSAHQVPATMLFRRMRNTVLARDRNRLIVEELVKPKNFGAPPPPHLRATCTKLFLFPFVFLAFISIHFHLSALSAKIRRPENRGTKTDRRELTIELGHRCRVKDSKA